MAVAFGSVFLGRCCCFYFRESEKNDWYSVAPFLCPPLLFAPHISPAALTYRPGTGGRQGLHFPPCNTPGVVLVVTLVLLWKNIRSVLFRAQDASEDLIEFELGFFKTRFPAGLNVKLGGCSLGTNQSTAVIA